VIVTGPPAATAVTATIPVTSPTGIVTVAGKEYLRFCSRGVVDCVGPQTAINRIRTGCAGDQVIARIAIDRIVTRTRINRVCAIRRAYRCQRSIDHIISVAANKAVILATARDGIRSIAAGQRIIPASALNEQRFTSTSIVDYVIAKAAINRVEARLSCYRIIAGIAVNHVVTRAT
jgi:hypothetical protein